jgi:hypothetical protein
LDQAEVTCNVGRLLLLLQQMLHCCFLLQAYKDMFYWGGRMSGLVRDLADSMDESPPPPHSLGAQLLKAKHSTGATHHALALIDNVVASCRHLSGGIMTVLYHTSYISLPMHPPTLVEGEAMVLSCCAWCGGDGVPYCGVLWFAGQPLERNQILAEIGIMWGAGYEVREAG